MFSLFSCLSQLYQEQCQDPPLGFNMPPMSGKIAWSRQLFRHIEQPMELLKVQEFLLGTSQGRSVVRKYNRIALVLGTLAHTHTHTHTHTHAQNTSVIQIEHYSATF